MTLRMNDITIVSHSIDAEEDSLFIIGSALDGPVGVPFVLNGDTDPFDALGLSPLAEALHSVRQSSSSEPILYRINGVHAVSELENDEGEPLMSFKSVGASDSYNDIEVKLFSTHLMITNTDGETRTYFFDRYPKSLDIANAINKDSYFGLIEVTASVVGENVEMLNQTEEEIEAYFEEGDSEDYLTIDRNPMSPGYNEDDESIEEAVNRIREHLYSDVEKKEHNHIIDSIPFKLLLLAGIYYEDDPSLVKELATFVEEKTIYGEHPSTVIIGTRPIHEFFVTDANTEEDEEDEEDEEIDFGDEDGELAPPDEDEEDFEDDYEYEEEEEDLELGDDEEEGILVETEEDIEPFEDRLNDNLQILKDLANENSFGELGKYVEIVYGDAYVNGREETLIPAVYSYAGMINELPVGVSATNKEISGISSMNHMISKKDVALLSGNGYTCIVPSIRRGSVSFSSTSHSPAYYESPLRKPHILKLTHYISSMITEMSYDLIGENVPDDVMDGLVKNAADSIDNLVEDGVIREFDIKHELETNNREAKVFVRFTPYSEVESIESMISVNMPGGFNIE